MIYEFKCYDCRELVVMNSKPFDPPSPPACTCGQPMYRVYGCEIDTSGCKDHDDIRPDKRCTPASRGISKERGAAIEAAHQRDIQHWRKQDKRGSNFRMTRRVPAALYHGKIRETGDKHYWDDPKNLARHKSTEV